MVGCSNWSRGLAIVSKSWTTTRPVEVRERELQLKHHGLLTTAAKELFGSSPHIGALLCDGIGLLLRQPRAGEERR